MFRVRVQRDDFDPAREEAETSARADGLGALVAFTGYCRSEGGRLAALELDHYPGMAEAEIETVLNEAQTRWPLLAGAVVHRHGVIPVGERIVFVAVAAAHRGDAFAAAEFVMDYLKARAPFWKRERSADGALGPWVDAKPEDDQAALRWRKL